MKAFLAGLALALSLPATAQIGTSPSRFGVDIPRTIERGTWSFTGAVTFKGTVDMSSSAGISFSTTTLDVVRRTGGSMSGQLTMNAPIEMGGNQFIKFSTTSANPAYVPGRLFYNSGQMALSYYNEEADVTLNIGQDNYIRVRNNSGSTITNGQIVRISGAHGAIAPTIGLAKADSHDNLGSVGVATHDIENNSFGYVTAQGKVHGLNTSAFTEGAIIYLSSITFGAYTQTHPAAPSYEIPIGIVIRQHSSHGIIYVTIQPIHSFGLGAANQVLGMNSVAGDPEYKNILGTTGRLTATHSAGAITFDIVPTSVTLQGNQFNNANQLIQADGAGLVPNADLDSSSVTKLGPSIDSSELPADGYAATYLNASGDTVTGQLKVSSNPLIVDGVGGVFRVGPVTSSNNGATILQSTTTDALNPILDIRSFNGTRRWRFLESGNVFYGGNVVNLNANTADAADTGDFTLSGGGGSGGDPNRGAYVTAGGNENANSSIAGHLILAAGAGSASDGSIRMRAPGAPSGEAGRITYAGKFGIGTTSPDADLDVKSSTSSGGYVIRASSQSGSAMWTVLGNGHVETSTAGAAAPALASCGTGPTSSGNDVAGKITLGTGGATGCVLTFNSPWTNPPACVVTNETTANLFRATSTKTQVTFSGTGLGGDVLAYLCLGYR